MLRVIVRADASTTIGTGHVSRCLTLARALREGGAHVTFVCRENDGDWCAAIEEQGFATSRLRIGDVEIRRGHAPAGVSSLGEGWQEDVEMTRAAIEGAGAKPDWLVVDQYALDQRWESALRPSVRRIMVIDDLADRPHDCDLLLDQNLVAQMHTRYVGKVPAACGLLQGPKFALLQPIYAELHDRTPPREGRVRRILISFGGADPHNLTGRALAAALSLNQSAIAVDVVLARDSVHAEAIRRQAAQRVGVRIWHGLPTLAPLMVQADLAIGAAGTTTWERLCLGLPALVVTIAENQRPIADELSRQGLIRWLGHQDAVTESMLADAVGQTIQQGLDDTWSQRCRATIDGRGTDRVRAALTATLDTPLQVRHARLDDETLVFDWANDEATRRQTFHPEPIPFATHRIWFRDRLRNPDGCHLYIVETTEGIPVGQVRLQREGDQWEIHYALAKVFRGRGLGRPMLGAALRRLYADIGSASIFGQVKADNRPSRRVFETLGFDVEHHGDGKEIVVYRSALSALAVRAESASAEISPSSKSTCESAIE